MPSDDEKRASGRAKEPIDSQQPQRLEDMCGKCSPSEPPERAELANTSIPDFSPPEL